MGKKVSYFWTGGPQIAHFLTGPAELHNLDQWGWKIYVFHNALNQNLRKIVPINKVHKIKSWKNPNNLSYKTLLNFR